MTCGYAIQIMIDKFTSQLTADDADDVFDDADENSQDESDEAA